MFVLFIDFMAIYVYNIDKTGPIYGEVDFVIEPITTHSLFVQMSRLCIEAIKTRGFNYETGRI